MSDHEEKRASRGQDGARLSNAHRNLLKERFGLWDQTIDEWGPISATKEDLESANFATDVNPPGILLPIVSAGARRSHGFLYRPDKPRTVEKKDGKPRVAKYEHPRGARNRIHVPRAVNLRLFGQDHGLVSVLVITEGPIKAEVATQEGLDCIALPGVWNFRQRFGDVSVPIEDLDRFLWSEFEAVEVCFDSDAATNLHVSKAERALAKYILSRGATAVWIVRLPPAADGSKMGLDDYLREHSIEDYRKLPRTAAEIDPPLIDLVESLTPETEKGERIRILGRILDEEHDPGQQELLFKAVRKHTGIPLRALRSSAQNAAQVLRQQRGDDNQPPAPELRFQVNEDGIYWLRGAHNWPVKIASRVDVIATTRDANNDNWGLLLQWPDKDDKKHEWAMPKEFLAGDAASVRAYLLSAGLPFIAIDRKGREAFTEYLLTATVEKSVRCVGRIGWHEGSYVLPSLVISPNDAEEIVFQTTGDPSHYWNTRGETKDWREGVGRRCVGNSRLILSVCCAFAGPLLSLVNAESGGIHFVGRTSIGKSTCLLVGGSVCGGGGLMGFCETWRATANALESRAVAHNDAALYFDEVSQLDAREAPEIAYQLCNGQGKARMDRNLGARKRAEWKLIFVSAGELTLREHASSAGKTIRGGAEIRFLNLPADAGADMGMFEDLHGAESAGVFSDQLRSAAHENYGAVFIDYVRWLVKNPKKAAKFVRDEQAWFQETFVPQGSSGEVRRAADRFALIGAAGQLATWRGLTGWGEEESRSVAERMFQEWLRNRGIIGPSDANAGVQAVLSFIEKYGDSRFQTSRHETIRDRAGFVRRIDGVPYSYYFFPKVFKEEVCKGCSWQDTLKELERRGYLEREPLNMTVKAYLPGLGRVRVYNVLASILEEDEANLKSNARDDGDTRDDPEETANQ
jgi:uncharacterized protein (DUF927 family)